ncbi:beta-3 adrenergic receptor-like [Topomyia yanbarensis]|uniref:beta-3 adrenergic receptor-like n=1 Tax=Topomyia yanbarensis TaxID=2498891 RepID=UPI00273BE2C0|nr:beta-3 adrenergic receptor-like [Topomyia yanbarensis]XP_058812380.1 beta-3 adrenergic receptor-like [Topomyia yanbarensis]XP_058812381.1 beta-3 adrenergic receptor-like [Topomyia yanbarensis]XP_058812382.1 beta-3 adrenergic receptor-like [Topomyia yanbarensis]XP_058812383.1 beta-3 adrenergic receptor-like [Topomyia yanbarensis]
MNDTLVQVRYFLLLSPTRPELKQLILQQRWRDDEDENQPRSENVLSDSEQTQLLLYDIFIPLLGTLIIVLNLAVVTSSLLLLRKGQQPYTTYLFLGNVAAADLLMGFAVIYGQYAPKEIRGEDNCAFLIGLIVSTTIVSVYSVGLIAVDRYLYIVYGLQYQRYITPSRAKLLIAATWLIGLIIGFLPAFGWRGDTDNGRVCWFIRLAPPALVILTTVVGILPLILVIVLYSIILHKALRRVAQLKKAGRQQQGVLSGNLRLFRGGTAAASNGNTTDSEQPLAEEQPKPTKCFRCCRKRPIDGRPPVDTVSTGRHPTKWKAIKVVMLTTGCFTVTWLPYFIASTMYVLCDPETNPDLCRGLQFAIASPLAILGFTNSLLNPFIYAWWHNGFRTSVKKLWRKMCRCCYKQNNNKSSLRNPVAATSSGGDESIDNGQQPRSSDTTTTTSVPVMGSPSYRVSSMNMTNNNNNNRTLPAVITYDSSTSDLENQTTDTDIDRPRAQTRL